MAAEFCPIELLLHGATALPPPCPPACPPACRIVLPVHSINFATSDALSCSASVHSVVGPPLMANRVAGKEGYALTTFQAALMVLAMPDFAPLCLRPRKCAAAAEAAGAPDVPASHFVPLGADSGGGGSKEPEDEEFFECEDAFSSTVLS